MFDLPEAKRIRRNEILSPSSSTRSSPEIPANDEDAHARLESLLAFDTFTPGPNQKVENEDRAHNHKERAANDDDDDEQEFEFRLFSAPSKKTTNSTTAEATSKLGKHKPDNEDIPGDGIKTQKLKIRLRSPTPVDAPLGEGRFVVPFRGWDYYFTKPELMHISAREPARLEAEEANRRKQFEDVAVTGAELLHWAQTTKTPGCHLPWRVTHLNPKAHKVPKSLLRESTQMAATTSLAAATTETKEKSKLNPGKKRRIILRTRAAKVAAAATAAAATGGMTEAEKRNKKNREKKIRKRQREREKKAALAASNGGDVVVPDAEDADSSD